MFQANYFPLHEFNDQPAKFAYEFGEALRLDGVVEVDGIPQPTVDLLRAEARQLFASELKEKYRNERTARRNPYYRYILPKWNITSRELFLIGGNSLTEQDFYADFPVLGEVTQNLFPYLKKTGLLVAKMTIDYLGVNVSPYETLRPTSSLRTIDEALNGEMGTIALARYPVDREKKYYFEPHIDGPFSFVTPNRIGDLKIRSPSGKWHKVQPSEGNLLVIPGEKIQIVSQGKIMASFHRVDPPEESIIEHRLTVAYAYP